MTSRGDPGDLQTTSTAALDLAPQAAAWARAFVGTFDTSGNDSKRFAAPHIVRIAVQAV